MREGAADQHQGEVVVGGDGGEPPVAPNDGGKGVNGQATPIGVEGVFEGRRALVVSPHGAGAIAGCMVRLDPPPMPRFVHRDDAHKLPRDHRGLAGPAGVDQGRGQQPQDVAVLRRF